jgi:hypothetical protein
MPNDRIQEILSLDFSALTEELWRELQSLISAEIEAETLKEEEENA